MSTQPSIRTPSLPAGYQQWDVDYRHWLALPSALVDELKRAKREALSREESGATPLAQQPTSRAREASVAPVASAVPGGAPRAPAAWREQWGEHAADDAHRVVCRFDALHSGQFLRERRHRSADVDVGKRLAALVDMLVHKGPDRRYVRASAAREQLADLEQAMPQFREPLRLLTNALALAEAAPRPVRIPPVLLLGPPGVGKTYFSQQVALALGVPHAMVGLGSPGSGSRMLGSDAHWGNSSTGLLFELLCQGDCANPVVLLDELDKASINSSTVGAGALSELLGVLEPQTACRLADSSVGIEFDASLVTYIATANDAQAIEPAVLSRFEVFVIEPPEPRMAVETARRVTDAALARMGLAQRLVFDRKCHYLLAHLSPRAMTRTVEKAAAAAVAERRERVEEADLWAELGLQGDARTH